jgi:hypothetical protein
MDHAQLNRFQIENTFRRSGILHARSSRTWSFCLELEKKLSAHVPVFLQSFGELLSILSCTTTVNEEKMFETHDKLFCFDERLDELRQDLALKIRYAFELLSKQTRDNRLRIHHAVSAEVSRMSFETREFIRESSQAHLMKLESIRCRFETELIHLVEMARNIRTNVLSLEQIRDKNSRTLRFVMERNSALRSPVDSLSREISAMLEREKDYENRTRPQLEAAKCKVSELQEEIRDRSFLLECLRQKKIHVERQADSFQKNKLRRELSMQCLSIAETDVTI